MGVRILFPDGGFYEGATATEVLDSLLGGWNPDTVPELKLAMDRRARALTGESVAEDPLELSDADFLRRLDSLGTLTLIEV